ncbi:SDR family NAD(P)-dependent oxidoreductase [Paenibacillus albus]|uniref:SDR family NAD(P)-dependent oxidoreductase n=1 Tax=Paenibacillus albus TaxID=2495582 RepID=A0A3S8ZYJ5_9BACL|nr:SDR family NAD(P)-dependent oxidoreductase [Paenibacillus albus]AZN38508.1 SDR family NAD(P)-dependent oxidoreductase [Paenibacillus albus]
MYKDKKILITGGTGTIGYQLTKKLLQENPAVIRIFSRDEYKQFNMSLEFQDYASKLRYLIGDIRDQQRLVRAMEGIDYVFHLAAMKHVPFCEYNPFEAVQTNVIGTQNVIQAAIQSGVKRVLFTSTDKAISPTNTYGASKLMAERLITAADYQKGPRSTILSAVRFGNVMGSRGSVIPLFKKHIVERGSIDVTCLDMKRYMMTLSQATSLLLEANELAKGGEVFVLKMPVVRLDELANVIIEQVCNKYGILNPIQINETGLRPGEKMFEELMSEDEGNSALEASHMYIIPSPFAKHSYVGVTKVTERPSIHSDEIVEGETLAKWLNEEDLI